MLLENLININHQYTTVIKSTIAEYDIKACGATAIKQIKGDEIYNKLMDMSKHDRVVKIGLMMRDEPGLSEKIQKLRLEWLNTFIESNKIKPTNIIETTPDSLILHKKIPTKLIFGDVEFRNKEGTFSSMFRLGRLSVFFDSMRGLMLVRGLTSQFDVNQSPLFKDFLTNYLYQFENLLGKDEDEMFAVLRNVRDNYLRSPEVGVYRDVMNKNKIGIRFKNKIDEIVYLDEDTGIEDNNSDYYIAKELNYINVIMPIMRAIQFIS